MVTALFTAAEFKTFYGISHTDYDTPLGDLATQVSELVTRWCNRADFGSTNYTETYDGTGTPQLVLRNTPVTSVTSVHVDAARTFASTSLLASTDYVVEQNTGIIEILPEQTVAVQILAQGSFPKGTKNVQVIYAGGYSTIPNDLKLGAILWASAIWNRRRHVGIVNENVGGMTNTFELGLIPRQAQALIAPFRKATVLGGFV